MVVLGMVALGMVVLGLVVLGLVQVPLVPAPSIVVIVLAPHSCALFGFSVLSNAPCHRFLSLVVVSSGRIYVHNMSPCLVADS
jgi:hypothetical protein